MGANLEISSTGEEVPPRRLDALQVRVRSITYLCDGVNAYEVVPLEDGKLPAFEAGAHIDLYFRDGRVRQYSLCNPPDERHRYVFAVQRESLGRGGSKAIHEIVHAGRILTISPPRNNFVLSEGAAHHVLIAGGIGVTPVVAMVHRLLEIGGSFELHYGVRSEDRCAFRNALTALGLGQRLHIYVDGGDPSRGMNLIDIVGGAPDGAQFYCCGPERLMKGLRDATRYRPHEAVHFEYFAVHEPAPQVPCSLMRAEADTIGVGFKVKLARRGEIFDVPDDKSIVQVLREHGVEIATSCEAGLCGSCRTPYLEGEPDHRDYVLDDDQRRREVLICCARSKTPMLVLDI